MSQELTLNLAQRLSPAARTSIAIRWAVLGMSGSGKSHTSSKLVELMLMVGAQCVILDNDGSWYGLRVPGKGPGFDIPVFGGIHGDIPLEPTAGTLVADLVVDNGISVVLDVSTMRKAKRHQFATDFAEQLFHRKQTATHRTPLCFVIEECDEFCPQTVSAGTAKMVGAFEDIGTQGRKYGIGSLWISQRPQSVNKQVLNQCEVLLVHYMYGSQERKAMSEWIVDKRMDVDLIDELTQLEVGEAYVWSPKYLKQIEKVKILPKQSADTSSTPEFGVENQKKNATLKPIDLSQVQEQMKATVEKAENSDPSKLQARIAQLTLELSKAKKAQPAAAAPAPVKVKTVKVDVPIIKDSQLERLHALEAKIDRDTRTLLEELGKLGKTVATSIAQFKAASRNPSSVPIQTVIAPAPKQAAYVRTTPPTPESDTGELTKGERAILNGFAKVHPMRLIKSQIGRFAGQSNKSSTFKEYLRRLKKSGLIVENNDEFELTEAGMAAIGFIPKAPATVDERIAMWRLAFVEGELKIFDYLMQMPGSWFAVEDIGSGSDQSLKSSTFKEYLRRMRANKVIEKSGDGKSYRIHPKVLEV